MELKGYKTKPGLICITSCIRDILNYNQFDVNESMVFVASKANMFYYEKFDIGKDSRIRIGGIYYDVLKVINNVLDYMQINMVHNDNETHDCILEFIKSNIDAGRPVLTILSRKYLDYMNDAFKDNIPHCVNIIGYDLKKGTLRVSDVYIPTKPISTYEGDLSIENYLKCIDYARDVFNNKFLFNCISLQTERSKKFNEFPYEKLIEPICAAGDIYLNQHHTIHHNILVGKTALLQFYDNIMYWFDVKENKDLKGLLTNIHNRLVDYGGMVTTNRFFSEYMEFLFEHTGNSKFVKLQDDFKYISKRWFIVANILCKSVFMESHDTKINLDNRLSEIINLEEALWDKILKI